jgi:hypothetical protein
VLWKLREMNGKKWKETLNITTDSQEQARVCQGKVHRDQEGGREGGTERETGKVQERQPHRSGNRCYLLSRPPCWHPWGAGSRLALLRE